MIDPISQSIIRKVNGRVKQEIQEQAHTAGISTYRMQCPACKALLVKEILLNEGCFRCGWKIRAK